VRPLVVASDVNPCEDEGSLNLGGVAWPQVVNIAELAASMQAHHVTDRARRIEWCVIGAG
jgi:hypothetical protein